MPIVLGDTTITGLAAGGLPAGIVNSTILADNAVTAAKLGFGGPILQVKVTEDGTNRVFNNVDYRVLETSITPTSASSKFWLLASLRIADTNPNGWFRFDRNGSSVGTDQRYYLDERMPQNDREIYNFTMTLLDSPNTTSAITYSVFYFHEGKNGGVHYLNTWSTNTGDTAWWPATSSLTVIEVAG
jgi:hypothetical protein